MTDEHANPGPPQNDPQRARELIVIPHRRAGILRRHHVGARNSRLDSGDGAAAIARASFAASSIFAAPFCRSSIFPPASAFRRPSRPRAMSSSWRRSAISPSGCSSTRCPTFSRSTDNLLQPTPDVASEMAKTFVKGVIAIDNRMISLIALDHVVAGRGARGRMSETAIRHARDRRRRGPDARRVRALARGFPPDRGDASRRRRHPSARDQGGARLFASRQRLRALGLASFREYCALVAGAEGVDERQKMLAALTTNVTKFFREPHHFDHLETRRAAAAAQRARGRAGACGCGPPPAPTARSPIPWRWSYYR